MISVVLSTVVALSGAPAAAVPPATVALAAAAQDRATADRLTAEAEALPATARTGDLVAARKAALDATVAAYPAQSPQLALAWTRYANALHEAGEGDPALEAARKAHAIALALPPADAKVLVETGGHLGTVLAARQEFDEARPVLQASLDLRRKIYGADSVQAAWADAELAVIDIRLGKAGEAIPRLAKAVEIERAKLPPGNPHRVGHQVNYGNSLTLNDQHEEAEKVLRAAAEEARMLPDSAPTRSLALDALAAEMLVQGRTTEAANLYDQAIAVRRRYEGGRPEDLADTIGSLAYVRLMQERPEDAEPLFVEARNLFQQGGVQTSAAGVLLGAGTAAAARGDRQLGFKRRREALDMVLSQPNPHPVAVGLFKFKLADSYVDIGDLDTAETMETEAIEVIKTIRPEGHFQRLNATMTLGWIKAQKGKTAEGMALVRPAVERTIADNRRLEIAQVKTTGVQENLEALGKALHAAYLAKDQDFGFHLSQVMIESDAGRAAAAENARLAAGTGALAETLRRRQTLAAERVKLDAEYLTSLSGDGVKAKEIEARIAAIDEEARAAQAVLDRDFPEHAALVRPEPISVAQVQERLKPGEALVVPVATERGLFTFAVTRAAVTWDRSALSRREARALVRRIRAALDVNGPVRAAVDASGGSAPVGQVFDREAAFELHQAIFTPAIRKLTDGAALYTIAADPALSALPFPLLVTEAPRGDSGDAAVLRATPWLIRKAAVQVAPSIPAMRAVAARPRGETRFFGAGAPALQGGSAVETASSYYRGRLADVTMVKSLPALPSAGRELGAMARAFGPREARVLTGAAATEAAVRAADLSQTRVIAFATHGLVAGDMEGLSEPALVFTPPAEASLKDDALLTASEAATLKLDADWVILSACNTAAGEAAGAPGYTGLARAFMFAGAQSVLASHWPVRDDAAARLTVDTVRRAAKGEAPAEALRRSMLALLDDRQLPGAADPAVWGPFVLVGR